MKTKIINLAIVFILNFLFLVLNCFSQWGTDVRLTNNSAQSFTSYNNQFCVAAVVDIVHIVWFDQREGNDEIFYKRSSDGGLTWGIDTRLTNNPAVSWYPSIAAFGSNVHIVWEDDRHGYREIYYIHSSDAGLSWFTETRLTNNPLHSTSAAVAVFESNIYVVWHDFSDGNPEIYFKRSTDGGFNWDPELRLTNDSASSYNPSISVAGSTIHLTWYDNRDGNDEIYYKRSTNGGISWGNDTRLTNNSSFSMYPCISALGANICITWQDFRDGNREIYFIRSTNDGINWGTETRLTVNSAESYMPSIIQSGPNIHIVWYDGRDGNYEIYYKNSTNAGVNWNTDTRLTDNSSYSWYSSIALFGTALYVVWTDNRDGNWEVYFKNNPTGNIMFVNKISSELPVKYQLFQNYPNPFNPVTTICFQCPVSGNVSLKIFDILGKEVATLVNESLQPGTYEVKFDGSGLSSGVYFYRMQTKDYIETKLMILVK